MATTEELRILITSQGAKAQKELTAINKQMGVMGKSATTSGKSLLKMGAIIGATTMAVRAFSSTLSSSVRAASDLEEQTAKFNTVFASTTMDMADVVEELGDVYAMSQRESKQYLSSMQDLLIPLGMLPDRAAELSTELVKLSADLGSFNNMPTSQVMADIQSAMVGNFETMKKYGVVLNETAIKQEAMNMGLYSGKGMVDAITKAEAARNIIMRMTEAAQGDMIRTQNSYANQLKKMKANVEDAKAALGSKLLPVLKLFLKDINSSREGLIQMAEAVGVFIAKVILGFRLAVQQVKGWALNLKVWSQKIHLWMVEMGEKIAETFGQEKAAEHNRKFAMDIREQIESTYNKLEETNALKQETMDTWYALTQEKEQSHQDTINNIQNAGQQKAEKQAKKHRTKEKKQEEIFQRYKLWLSEQEIAQRQAMRTIDMQSYMSWSQFIMSSADKNSRWQFAVWKAFAIQQAIINTHSAALKGYEAMIGIPVVGPGLAVAAAATAVAFGTMQVQRIAATKFGEAAEGGLIPGTPAGTPLIAGEGGRSEAIIPLENTDRMEELGGIGGGMNVTIQVENLYGSEDMPRNMVQAMDRELTKLVQDRNSTLGKVLG